MLSSGAIMTQIHGCEEEIRVCKNSIQTLEILVDGQAETCRKYLQKVESYEFVIARKQRKANTVYDRAGESVVVKKFQDQMNAVLNEGIWSTKKQQLLDIDTQISNELKTNESNLSNLRQELSRLRAHLAGLWNDYHSAVQREAEEARQAAEAAAKNSKGGK